MSIQVKNLDFAWPNGDYLFQKLYVDIPSGKTALVGRNGCGKSTLFQLLSGQLKPNKGSIVCSGPVLHIPQGMWKVRQQTALQILGVEKEHQALQAILAGSSDQAHYEQLNNRWELEQEIESALEKVGLSDLSWNTECLLLSGGEFIRLQFASIHLSQCEWIFLDEPSNHLDEDGRQLLFQLITESSSNFLVISHDIELLKIFDYIIELSEQSCKRYGGNYDFYRQQKDAEQTRLETQFKQEGAQLKKQIRHQQLEKQKSEKKNAQGKKRFIATGGDRNAKKVILDGAAKTQRNQSRIQKKKRAGLESSKSALAALQEKRSNLHFDFGDQQESIPKGKMLLEITEMNISFVDTKNLWKNDLSFRINGSERWHIRGKNGSGKTTLLKIIQGNQKHFKGSIRRSSDKIATLDQHLDFLSNKLTVFENLIEHAHAKISEGELRTRANRLGFDQGAIFKKTGILSGGERLRLALACLLATNHSPDLLLLDEPTNNLDIESKDILLAALQQYRGSLLIISHDVAFTKGLRISNSIELVSW